MNEEKIEVKWTEKLTTNLDDGTEIPAPSVKEVGCKSMLCCPFCGDDVELEYEPIVSYSVNCCVSMSLQICDALEERGVRFDDGYECVQDENHENGYGEYTEAARLVCREELTKGWNTRAKLA